MKRYANGLMMSFSMFSIFPMPKNSWDDRFAGAALGCMPIVGLTFGTLYYASFSLLLKAGISPLLFTPVFILIWYAASGFLHLDGFIDSCDALLSSRSLAERLRILKDPHIGGFGVVCLFFLLLFSACSVFSLARSGNSTLMLIFLPVLSRSLSGLLLFYQKPVFQEGYAAYFQENAAKTDRVVLWAFFISCLVALFLCCGFSGLLTALFASIGFLLSALVFTRAFGGVNGDAAGFCITISEVVGLFALALL